MNPERRFDRFNIALTGITPEMVADKPTFPELWREIGPLMDSGLLIAHNAPFDMSVLAKCLRDYGIFFHRQVPYACTCQMSRRLLPQLPNHRLDTLCRLYGDMEEKKWLDNQEVCLLLKVSPRTLQTLRDNGTLAYTQICHKTYYKPGDVESIIRIVEERRKRAESMGRSI